MRDLESTGHPDTKRHVEMGIVTSSVDMEVSEDGVDGVDGEITASHSSAFRRKPFDLTIDICFWQSERLVVNERISSACAKAPTSRPLMFKPQDIGFSWIRRGSITSRNNMGEGTDPWHTHRKNWKQIRCGTINSHLRGDASISLFKQTPRLSFDTRLGQTVKEHRIFHRVKGRGQVIETRVNRVTIPDVFWDNFKTVENCIRTGYTLLISRNGMLISEREGNILSSRIMFWIEQKSGWFLYSWPCWEDFSPFPDTMLEYRRDCLKEIMWLMIWQIHFLKREPDYFKLLLSQGLQNSGFSDERLHCQPPLGQWDCQDGICVSKGVRFQDGSGGNFWKTGFDVQCDWPKEEKWSAQWATTESRSLTTQELTSMLEPLDLGDDLDDGGFTICLF